MGVCLTNIRTANSPGPFFWQLTWPKGRLISLLKLKET